MTTVKQIFDLAVYLMGENNDTSGQTDTSDTREYKVRTIGILNVIRNECYPYSDTYKVTEPGKRPTCEILKDFDSVIDIDDGIAQGVMPYGLAARLLADENPSLSAFFQDCYSELLRQYGRGVPSASEAIVDVYGGYFPYNDFGAW